MTRRKSVSKNSHKSQTLAEKRPVGRPATGRRRGKQIAFRLADDEFTAIESAAKAAGQTVGVWTLAAALDAAGYVPPKLG